MNFPDLSLPPIVIVDDSQDDAFLLRYRLRLGGIANPVTSFESASAALAYFRSPMALKAQPEFLFTDIKTPGATDLIADVRDRIEWDQLKVVVTTYSNDPADLQHALELRVNGYLLKFPAPENLAEFVLHGPWFSIPRGVVATSHALCA